jgi:hypothetical protein
MHLAPLSDPAESGLILALAMLPIIALAVLALVLGWGPGP